MPLVRIEMIKGKSREYKDKMLDCIHEGLVESIGIEDWDRFQRIVEIDKDDFETAPGKTDDFTIIEIIEHRRVYIFRHFIVITTCRISNNCCKQKHKTK